jgi:hypothetical protein
MATQRYAIGLAVLPAPALELAIFNPLKKTLTDNSGKSPDDLDSSQAQEITELGVPKKDRTVMRLAATELDPNDPRLTEELQPAVIPEPIASLQALRLLEHSLFIKARALEDCEEFVYLYRCPNDHIWPVPPTCHQRFCPKCADRIALGHVKKYDNIDIGTEPLLYIEISQFGDLSPQFVEEFGKYVGAGFKRLERDSDASLGTLWNSIPTQDRLIARLILLGDG